MRAAHIPKPQTLAKDLPATMTMSLTSNGRGGLNPKRRQRRNCNRRQLEEYANRLKKMEGERDSLRVDSYNVQ
jgi:hypothetical protein